jgi:hypothetical protein
MGNMLGSGLMAKHIFAPIFVSFNPKRFRRCHCNNVFFFVLESASCVIITKNRGHEEEVCLSYMKLLLLTNIGRTNKIIIALLWENK